MTEEWDRLDGALAQEALVRLGHCSLPTGDGTLVLIGPDEPKFWPHFTRSADYADPSPDPLDRWSHRVLERIAANVGAQALFPSDGPPFHPFYSWALATGQLWASPIGLLVHDSRGLFVSFRGALVLPMSAPVQTAQQPCPTCAAPCASACPVDAFAAGYDVAACKAHLASPAGADCMALGCRARRACPVGQGTRLPAQAAFHMESFL